MLLRAIPKKKKTHPTVKRVIKRAPKLRAAIAKAKAVEAAPYASPSQQAQIAEEIEQDMIDDADDYDDSDDYEDEDE